MTRTNYSLSMAALISVLLSLLLWVAANAQVQDPSWSEPYRLSSLYGEASGAVMLSDEFGFVHVFWAESGFDHQRSIIYYATYNGETWSTPADIYASWPGVAINTLSASVDNDGYLHLVWSGAQGPLMYSKAEIDSASSARSWQEPIRLDVAAARIELAVDDAGVIHIVYADFSGDQPGIYYFFSENQGKAWTYPAWLDPDIPVSAVPAWLDMAMDEQGGIHIVWSYNDQGAATSEGRWVRYSHSLDGGETWLEPFSVDIADEEVDELRISNPGIVVSGEEVHLIWSGNSMTQREHRFSLDRGQNWSETERIFGDLEGNAIGDGLASDALGRIHFVGQIRWPQAIYHGIWDSESWTDPTVVYLINQGLPDEEFAGRIHAHNVRLATHNGNQLVMTFTTAPSEQQSVLYAMQSVLTDVPETAASPLPGEQLMETQVPPSPDPTNQVEPTTTPEGGTSVDLPAEVGPDPSPTRALWIGTVTSLILVVGIVVSRIWRPG